MKGGVLLPIFLSLLKEKWVATKARPQKSNSQKVIGLRNNHRIIKNTLSSTRTMGKIKNIEAMPFFHYIFKLTFCFIMFGKVTGFQQQACWNDDGLRG